MAYTPPRLLLGRKNPQYHLHTTSTLIDVNPIQPCILLAEDNGILRYALSVAITNAGYRVIEAEDGSDALQRAAEFNGCIQLLVTDIRMPRMDGHQLSTRIRETRPDIKIIVLSAHHEGQFPPDAPWPDCSLVKPVYPDVVVRKIEEMLGLSACRARGGAVGHSISA